MDLQPVPHVAMCMDLLLCERAKAHGAERVLSGHAGDVAFGGPVSFAPLLWQGHPLRAIRRAMTLPTPVPQGPLSRIRRRLLGPILRPLVPRRALAGRRMPSWLTPHGRTLLRPCVESMARGQPRTPDEWMTYFCNHPALATLRTAWGQLEAATGTSPIDVFHQPELLRFMARVPPMARIEGNLERGLYRMAMKGLLPEALRLREDKALGQPGLAAAALAAQAESLLEDLSSLCELEQLDLASGREFRPSFQTWIRGVHRGERLDHDPSDESWSAVWHLLSVEAFLRRYRQWRQEA